MQNNNQMVNDMGYKQQQQQQSLIKKVQKKVAPNDIKKRNDAATKSPAVKKVKEIQYVKVIAIQQHYKVSDFKQIDENEEDDEAVQPQLDEETEQKPVEEQVDQIVENQPDAEEEEAEKLSEREPEAHDNYEASV